MEMSYQIQDTASNWGRPELSFARNQEDVLQKYISAPVLFPRLLLLDIAGNRIVKQTDLWSDPELFVLCCITPRS